MPRTERLRAARYPTKSAKLNISERTPPCPTARTEATERLSGGGIMIYISFSDQSTRQSRIDYLVYTRTQLQSHAHVQRRRSYGRTVYLYGDRLRERNLPQRRTGVYGAERRFHRIPRYDSITRFWLNKQ